MEGLDGCQRGSRRRARRAAGWAVFEGYFSAVGLDDVSGDGEAESGAAVGAAFEGAEDAFAAVLGDAWAVVVDGEFDGATGMAGGKVDLGGVAAGVVDEVGEGAPDGVWAEVDDEVWCVVSRVMVAPARRALVATSSSRVVTSTGWACSVALAAGEGEVAADHAVHFGDVGGHFGDVVAEVGGGGEDGEGEASEAGEGGAEVVADARRAFRSAGRGSGGSGLACG